MKRIRGGIALLFLLFGAAFAAPTISGWTGSDTCTLTCSETPSKFKYEAGKTYRYTYEGTSLATMQGAESESSMIKFSANVDVDVLHSHCEMALKLSDVRLEESQDPNSGAFQPNSASDSFKKSLEQNRLRFGFNDGEVKNVCPETNEEDWVLNLKRGILSSMQNTADHLNDNMKVDELDVMGNCQTTYTVLEGTSSGSMKFRKERDIMSCTGRHGTQLTAYAIPYTTHGNINTPPLLNSSHVCEMTASNQELQESKCEESHIFRPFSNQESGARMKMTQHLTFVSKIETSERIGKSEADLKRMDAIPNWDDRRNLQYTHKFEDEKNDHDMQAINSKIEKLCSETTSEISEDTPYYFNDLIYAIRRTDLPTLKAAFGGLGTLCSGSREEKAKRFFFDALPAAGTTASVSMIRNLLTTETLSEEDAKRFLMSLTFIKNPNEEMIKEANTIITAQNPKFCTKTATLSTSTLIHTFCRTTENCEQNAEVQDFIKSLESQLGSDCSDTSNKDKIIVALKGIGNIGRLVDSQQKIQSCFEKKSNRIDVRIAALQSMRRVSCTVSRSAMLPLYQDRSEDTEIRIGSYLGLMKCPTHDTIREIKLVLENEDVNQVGSYVWTHLTNIDESSSPLLRELGDDIRNILLESILEQKYSMDMRKFSKNYEWSFHSDDYNVGAQADANVIFTPESFVPRSAWANLSLDLFGHSVNFFEFGGRLESFESVFEPYFGPIGSRHHGNVKSHQLASGNKKNNVKIDMEALPQESPRGSFYIKSFGNEIGFWSTDDFNLPEIQRSLTSWFLNLQLKLEEEHDVDLMRNMVFLDTSIVVPTSLGFPMNLTVNGTLSASMKLKGHVKTIDRQNIDIEGEMRPSATVQIVGHMGIDAFYAKNGLKVRGTAHTSTGLSGTVKIKGLKSWEFNLNTPMEEMKVIDIKSQVFLVHGDEEKPQELLKATNKKEGEFCTGKKFETVFGVQMCTAFSVPNAVAIKSAPFSPFTGPVSASLIIKKKDIGTKGFTFKTNFDRIKQRSSNTIKTTKAEIEFDTPGSTIKRKFTFNFEVDHVEKEADINIDTPWKKIDLSGKLRNDNDLRRLDFSAKFDDQEYGFVAELPFEATGNMMKYTPRIEVRRPQKQNVVISGTATYTKYTSMEYDLVVEKLTSTGQDIKIKGFYGKRTTGTPAYVFDLDMNHPWMTVEVRSSISGFYNNFRDLKNMNALASLTYNYNNMGETKYRISHKVQKNSEWPNLDMSVEGQLVIPKFSGKYNGEMKMTPQSGDSKLTLAVYQQIYTLRHEFTASQLNLINPDFSSTIAIETPDQNNYRFHISHKHDISSPEVQSLKHETSFKYPSWEKTLHEATLKLRGEIDRTNRKTNGMLDISLPKGTSFVVNHNIEPNNNGGYTFDLNSNWKNSPLIKLNGDVESKVAGFDNWKHDLSGTFAVPPLTGSTNPKPFKVLFERQPTKPFNSQIKFDDLELSGSILPDTQGKYKVSGLIKAPLRNSDLRLTIGGENNAYSGDLVITNNGKELLKVNGEVDLSSDKKTGNALINFNGKNLFSVNGNMVWKLQQGSRQHSLELRSNLHGNPFYGVNLRLDLGPHSKFEIAGLFGNNELVKLNSELIIGSTSQIVTGQVVYNIGPQYNYGIEISVNHGPIPLTLYGNKDAKITIKRNNKIFLVTELNMGYSAEKISYGIVQRINNNEMLRASAQADRDETKVTFNAAVNFMQMYNWGLNGKYDFSSAEHKFNADVLKNTQPFYGITGSLDYMSQKKKVEAKVTMGGSEFAEVSGDFTFDFLKNVDGSAKIKFMGMEYFTGTGKMSWNPKLDYSISGKVLSTYDFIFTGKDSSQMEHLKIESRSKVYNYFDINAGVDMKPDDFQIIFNGKVAVPNPTRRSGTSMHEMNCDQSFKVLGPGKYTLNSKIRFEPYVDVKLDWKTENNGELHTQETDFTSFINFGYNMEMSYNENINIKYNEAQQKATGKMTRKGKVNFSYMSDKIIDESVEMEVNINDITSWKIVDVSGVLKYKSKDWTIPFSYKHTISEKNADAELEFTCPSGQKTTWTMVSTNDYPGKDEYKMSFDMNLNTPYKFSKLVLHREFEMSPGKMNFVNSMEYVYDLIKYSQNINMDYNLKIVGNKVDLTANFEHDCLQIYRSPFCDSPLKMTFTYHHENLNNPALTFSMNNEFSAQTPFNTLNKFGWKMNHKYAPVEWDTTIDIDTTTFGISETTTIQSTLNPGPMAKYRIGWQGKLVVKCNLLPESYSTMEINYDMGQRKTGQSYGSLITAKTPFETYTVTTDVTMDFTLDQAKVSGFGKIQPCPFVAGSPELGMSFSNTLKYSKKNMRKIASNDVQVEGHCGNNKYELKSNVDMNKPKLFIEVTTPLTGWEKMSLDIMHSALSKRHNVDATVIYRPGKKVELKTHWLISRTLIDLGMELPTYKISSNFRYNPTKTTLMLQIPPLYGESKEFTLNVNHRLGTTSFLSNSAVNATLYVPRVGSISAGLGWNLDSYPYEIKASGQLKEKFFNGKVKLQKDGTTFTLNKHLASSFQNFEEIQSTVKHNMRNENSFRTELSITQNNGIFAKSHIDFVREPMKSIKIETRGHIPLVHSDPVISTLTLNIDPSSKYSNSLVIDYKGGKRIELTGTLEMVEGKNKLDVQLETECPIVGPKVGFTVTHTYAPKTHDVNAKVFLPENKIITSSVNLKNMDSPSSFIRSMKFSYDFPDFRTFYINGDVTSNSTYKSLDLVTTALTTKPVSIRLVGSLNDPQRGKMLNAEFSYDNKISGLDFSYNRKMNYGYCKTMFDLFLDKNTDKQLTYEMELRRNDNDYFGKATVKVFGREATLDAQSTRVNRKTGRFSVGFLHDTTKPDDAMIYNLTVEDLVTRRGKLSFLEMDLKLTEKLQVGKFLKATNNQRIKFFSKSTFFSHQVDFVVEDKPELNYNSLFKVDMETKGTTTYKLTQKMTQPKLGIDMTSSGSFAKDEEKLTGELKIDCKKSDGTNAHTESSIMIDYAQKKGNLVIAVPNKHIKIEGTMYELTENGKDVVRLQLTNSYDVTKKVKTDIKIFKNDPGMEMSIYYPDTPNKRLMISSKWVNSSAYAVQISHQTTATNKVRDLYLGSRFSQGQYAVINRIEWRPEIFSELRALSLIQKMRQSLMSFSSKLRNSGKVNQFMTELMTPLKQQYNQLKGDWMTTIEKANPSLEPILRTIYSIKPKRWLNKVSSTALYQKIGKAMGNFGYSQPSTPFRRFKRSLGFEPQSFMDQFKNKFSSATGHLSDSFSHISTSMNHHWSNFKDTMSQAASSAGEHVSSWTQPISHYYHQGHHMVKRNFNNVLGKLMQNEDFSKMVQYASDAADHGKWLMNHYEIPKKVSSAVKSAPMKILTKVMRHYEIHVNEFDLLNWDPKNGLIEFAVPYPKQFIKSVRRNGIIPVMKYTAEKMYQFKPSMDSFYDLIPSTNYREWLPPYTSTAMILGSQEYVTFDGRKYKFAGVCPYVLTLDKKDGNFSVVANYEKGGSGKIKSVTVTVQNHEILMTNGYKVKINGKPTQLPAMRQNTTIIREPTRVILSNIFGLTVDCDWESDICTVQVSGWYHNRLGGLFGNDNNEPSDDFMMPNGKTTDNLETFADSWKAGKKCSSTGNIADQTDPESRSAEARRVCGEFFKDKKSPMSRCFGKVSEKKFYSFCVRAVDKRPSHVRPEKVACMIARKYQGFCEKEGIRVRVPKKCIQCEIGSNTFNAEESYKFLMHETPGVSSGVDVVFAIEEKPCNVEPLKKIPDAAKRIKQEMAGNGLNNVKFGIVGFGTLAEKCKPHLHTMSSEILNDAKQVEAGLKFTKMNGKDKNETLSAMEFIATEFPFRAGSRRIVIVMSCDGCKDSRISRYGPVEEQLRRNGIQLHYLTPFTFMDQLKRDTVYGLDKETVFTDKRPDKQLYDHVSKPRDSCTALAFDTRGSVFSSHDLAKGDRSFMDTFATRVAKDSQPSDCQICECTLGIKMREPVSICRPCHSQTYTTGQNSAVEVTTQSWQVAGPLTPSTPY